VIRRLLIANSGAIAIRIARAAREMGIVPLGIYSQADQNAWHRTFMEESACVGPAPATDSYLNVEAILQAARTLKADALHPGYGFLSERAEFARAVGEAGLVFVGPSPEAMAAMGSKRAAKDRVSANGVPVVPGYNGADQTRETLAAEAQNIGTPLLIKASAGGGGRGMRVVTDLAQFDEALDAAQREALAAFGDQSVLLERYLKRPRHIEFQVLGDRFGHIIHLGERECSIQRRHQKIIEEAPSIALSESLRAEMGSAAVRAAQSVEYSNAGTVEFMLGEDGAYYFLEMNTRLQVEHPVTELVHGIDLVQWQLRIAAGERLDVQQADVRPAGWAIEARIYAEDPYNQMLPSTGTITQWTPPQGADVRLDSGVRAGSEVSVYYDSMLAKLIVRGDDRPAAVRAMERALDEFTIAGVQTNIPLLQWIVADDAYARGDTTTAFLSERLPPDAFSERKKRTPVQLAGAIAHAIRRDEFPWRLGGVGIPFGLSDGHTTYGVAADRAGSDTWRLRGDSGGLLHLNARGATLDGVELPAGRGGLFYAPPPSSPSAAAGGVATAGRILAPMPGKVIKVAVKAGDTVEAHDLLLVLEAMKMEHRIEAPAAGTVSEVFVRPDAVVTAAAPLVELR